MACKDVLCHQKSRESHFNYIPFLKYFLLFPVIKIQIYISVAEILFLMNYF